MTATVAVPISETSWTELSNGSASVSVQRLDHVPVLVRVETAVPLSSDKFGIVLSEVYDSATFNGLGGTDKVYGRAIGSTTSVGVVRS